MSDRLSVLLVEDDVAVRTGFEQALQLAGFSVESFGSAEQACARVSPDLPGIIVSDVKLPGMDGLALLRKAIAADPRLPVILVTGHGDISMAVQAMQDGAYDFVEKPFSSERLVEVVRRAAEKRSLTLEVASLQKKLAARGAIEATLIGYSAQIDQVRRLILNLADTSASVLILGETGTGKELVARCFHEQSGNRPGHFVALNCGGLPEALFESEVLGHEAGAFTGAAKRRVGKIEHAHQGTLFLDEIENMPCALQIKLLRVLQEQKIERLGSNEVISIDSRVIAASKEDLQRLINLGRFREDLYYRLNVITVNLPPLRERREDILLLFEHFILTAARRYERDAAFPSAIQRRQLLAHSWPGNVRELSNVASRFVLGAAGDCIISGQHAADGTASLQAQVENFERCIIEQELRQQNGCVAAASDKLGVPRKTLYSKLSKYRILSGALPRLQRADAAAKLRSTTGDF